MIVYGSLDVHRLVLLHHLIPLRDEVMKENRMPMKNLRVPSIRIGLLSLASPDDRYAPGRAGRAEMG